MDEWAVMAILAFVIAIVLPIGLFFAFLGLNKKIKDLQRQIAQLGSATRPDGPIAAQPAAIPSTLTVQETPVSEPPADDEDVTPDPTESPVWQTADAGIPSEPDSIPTPKSFVFKKGFGDKIKTWMQKNWFFAVAGISLALAGVFLVQYGVDQGLLTPRLRVMGAIGLGSILMAVGEYVRRKLGSDEEGSFELLPSVFSGAGLVSVFAGVLAARMLYGLIEPTTALIGLSMVGMCAIVFGWYYGPFLAIMGVFGALLSPFIVGGSGESAEFLYFFFAGVAAIALAIDSFKRWAWLSALGLIGAYLAAWILYAGIGAPMYLMAFALIVAAVALVIPERRLVPIMDGAMLSDFARYARDKNKWAEFPTRLAGLSFIASAVMLGVVFMDNDGSLWPILGALALMVLAAVFWMRRAPALFDLAFIPALGALVAVYYEGFWRGDVRKLWSASISRESIDFPPPTLAIILGGALMITLAFTWRSWQSPKLRRTNAGFGAAFAVLVAVSLELVWAPRVVLGETVWALYLAAIAIIMTVLTERFARIDHEDRTRPALFALSAITMISFMCFVLFGSVGLTVSLAVLAFSAAVLGQRFNLPLLDYYVQAAAIAVSWRLVLEPGIEWAFDAGIQYVLFAYGTSIALLIAAYWVRRLDARPSLRVVLESACWSLSGVFVSVLLVKYFEYIDAGSPFMYMSVLGMVWMIMAFNQLWRVRSGVPLRRTRMTLTGIYMILGFGGLGLSVTLFNPLIGLLDDLVLGPYVFDNLLVAYGLPALVFAFVALKFIHIPMWMRKVIGVLSASFAALYVGSEIRRWWHGADLNVGPTTDGELYSYTVAMLLVAAILLGFAFVRKSATLRKVALALVALTVAKVFLIDMSGLSGLIRVVSFLVLGLVLAAMAWVNRILQKNEEAD